MKKLFSSVSPFLLVLLPVFVCIGILAFAGHDAVSPERLNASLNFELPAVKGLFVKALF
ncbi:hypothetical protein [Pedobacter sp. BS3]|uniref:hypothetical protein n=1 Tax=Pedobacter sp. BS3 TaxID=2567937 RepID=UPI001659D0FD|nr:hypothetical protein [Pedobacter sp. BS3]